MNKILIILGIILILINTTIDLTKKILYLILFILSVNYSHHLKSSPEISKTYYINVQSSNKYVSYMADTLDFILKNRNWVKLNKTDALNKKEIGFTFSNIDKKNVLKSQINFRILN